MIYVFQLSKRQLVESRKANSQMYTLLAGWQVTVTMCDAIWHTSSHSSQTGCIPVTAIYLYIFWKLVIQSHYAATC